MCLVSAWVSDSSTSSGLVALSRWQYIILVVIVLLMICVLLKEVSGGTGLLAGLQNFANSELVLSLDPDLWNPISQA